MNPISLDPDPDPDPDLVPISLIQEYLKTHNYHFQAGLQIHKSESAPQTTLTTSQILLHTQGIYIILRNNNDIYCHTKEQKPALKLTNLTHPNSLPKILKWVKTELPQEHLQENKTPTPNQQTHQSNPT